jgi:hypothetical protein
MRRTIIGGGLLVLAAVVGCGSSEEGELEVDGGLEARDASAPAEAGEGDAGDADTPARDGGDRDTGAAADAADSDAGSQDGGGASTGVAPMGARGGERAIGASAETLSLAPGASAVFRVDAAEAEHVGSELVFSPTDLDVTVTLERWDGAVARALATTDGGRGIRTIAAFDPRGPRTFWFAVKAGARSVSNARFTVRRTPFADGERCSADCARLLQLPIRIDPRTDGYDHASSTVFRYQFGRRDLVMLTRHLGRTLAARGYQPFVPEDLSQWNGETPGVDVGAPRHASHQRGKDIDLSLYGADGLAPWRSYCRTTITSEGRECVAGTITNYDGFANALLFGGYFASGRATMMFLDRELIPATRTGASRAIAQGLLPAGVSTSFTNGVALQHWPNHDNHVHIRMSEIAYDVSRASAFALEPFEAP